MKGPASAGPFIPGIHVAVHLVSCIWAHSLMLLHAGKGAASANAFGGGRGPLERLSGPIVGECKLDRLMVDVA